MHTLLEKELATYESRTPSSREALKKAQPRMPLGVASNFRSYEPWPLYIKDAKGTHIHDLDGNEYIDFNLCFGALMAGHCHPAVVKRQSRSGSKPEPCTACPTPSSSTSPTRSASASPWTRCASAPVARKSRCTPSASRADLPAATRSSRWKAPITACMTRCWSA